MNTKGIEARGEDRLRRALNEQDHNDDANVTGPHRHCADCFAAFPLRSIDDAEQRCAKCRDDANVTPDPFDGGCAADTVSTRPGAGVTMIVGDIEALLAQSTMTAFDAGLVAGKLSVLFVLGCISSTEYSRMVARTRELRLA